MYSRYCNSTTILQNKSLLHYKVLFFADFVLLYKNILSFKILFGFEFLSPPFGPKRNDVNKNNLTILK